MLCHQRNYCISSREFNSLSVLSSFFAVNSALVRVVSISVVALFWIVLFLLAFPVVIAVSSLSPYFSSARFQLLATKRQVKSVRFSVSAVGFGLIFSHITSELTVLICGFAVLYCILNNYWYQWTESRSILMISRWSWRKLIWPRHGWRWYPEHYLEIIDKCVCLLVIYCFLSCSTFSSNPTQLCWLDPMGLWCSLTKMESFLSDQVLFRKRWLELCPYSPLTMPFCALAIGTDSSLYRITIDRIKVFYG